MRRARGWCYGLFISLMTKLFRHIVVFIVLYFKRLLYSSSLYSYDAFIFIIVDVTYISGFVSKDRPKSYASGLIKFSEIHKRNPRVSYYTRFGGRGREGGRRERWVKVGYGGRGGRGQIREGVRGREGGRERKGRGEGRLWSDVFV